MFALWFGIFLIPVPIKARNIQQNETAVQICLYFCESWAIAVRAELLGSLEYRKFCARYVPCFLTKEHKRQRIKYFLTSTIRRVVENDLPECLQQ
jgi:hypothetical protein